MMTLMRSLARLNDRFDRWNDTVRLITVLLLFPAAVAIRVVAVYLTPTYGGIVGEGALGLVLFLLAIRLGHVEARDRGPTPRP